MESDSGKRIRGRSRGRARGRARGAGRVRGRTKKAVKIIESDDEVDSPAEESPVKTELLSERPIIEEISQQTPTVEHQFDLEADISQLEAPTFTTINRGPPEPMLRLRWDHRVNLIGEKVLNPMIHCCDKCLKPILIYGRMIPCKHVFCLSCGKREDKVCPRCMEKVTRVEQTGLGTVFMCTHGGTRYGNAGCRRTYLSQRDLQAHINHRHISGPPQPVPTIQTDAPQYMHSKPEIDSTIGKIPSVSMQSVRIKQIPSHMVQPIGNDPRVSSIVSQSPSEHRQSHRPQQMMNIPNYSQNTTSLPSNPPMRTNLITVPIQDNSMTTHDMHNQQNHHYYPPPTQVNYTGYSVPPPTTQNQNYYAAQQYSAAPQQQPYASSGPPAIRPFQENQYAPQQPVPAPQSQWSQHQQQFYR